MIQRRVFLAAGVAAAAGAFGIARFAIPAPPENLSLQSLSGSELASDPGTLLVDIRRPDEWKKTGVVEGALLVTYTSPENFLKAVALKIADGQQLALICRSGNRTSRASRKIAGLVDFNVVDVQGGMLRILKEGYRPVAPSGEMGCQTC